jgi:hypothetical protein
LNTVIRKIFGSRKNQIREKYKILLVHNEELRDSYRPPSIVMKVKCRKLQWAGHVSRIDGAGNVYRILLTKPLAKHRWQSSGLLRSVLFWLCTSVSEGHGAVHVKDQDVVVAGNIKTDIKETVCEDGRWMELVVDLV